jgi:hypothetical protein
MWSRYCTLALFGLLLLAGCDRKVDISEFEEKERQAGGQSIGDTSYVEVFPPFSGFETPVAVLVGNDQLIYVADYDRNEVVMLDAGGTRQTSRTLPHPICLAQNSKLDLYVGGEVQAAGDTHTIGAIYRIALARLDTTYLSRIDTVINPSTGDTTITPVFRDTSFFPRHRLEQAPARIVWQEPANGDRRFTGIGILPGNEYLVTRRGNDNSSFVDPDTRVLRFSSDDILITPLADLVTRPSGGTAITDIRNLTGIMIFPSSSNFLITQNSEGVAYGAIWMTYQNTPDFQGWVPRFDPAKPEQRSIDFIRPYRYRNASAAAYDRRRQEVFIVDADLDSVFKFDRNGRLKPESFGHYRSMSTEFPHGLTNPRGVAFSNDCTLYIADTGNKIIRRFKLSTQVQCF